MVALADTSVIKLTSQTDGDLSDRVSDDTTIASSKTDTAPGGVSLFDGGSPLSSIGADAGDVANLAAVAVLDDPFGSFVDNDLGDDATNVNTPTSNGMVVAQSDVSLFDENSSLGSGETDPIGVWDLAPVALANSAYSFAMPATDGLSNTGALSAAVVMPVDTAAPSPLTVDPIPAITVANGATAKIDGASAQSVTFEGSTGTLILNDALAFTGQVSGLSGSDAIDLADVSYGPSTQATFLGDTEGGTLTITNGTQTANIALVGDYLSSYWTVSSDGNGGTLVVDPTSSNTWQPVNIGAGGYLSGMDVAPDGTMVVRTDTYGAYIWNGSQWQQLVTSTSMPSGIRNA